jgi:hypothetical protein
MNIAMGEKLVWRMITRKLEWWKKVLWKKYFKGSRMRCIDSPLESQKGSHIMKLIAVMIPLIRAKITWIPGNGKKIQIWNDSILGNEALSSKIHLAPLKTWMVGAGLKTLV